MERCLIILPDVTRAVATRRKVYLLFLKDLAALVAIIVLIRRAMVLGVGTNGFADMGRDNIAKELVFTFSIAFHVRVMMIVHGTALLVRPCMFLNETVDTTNLKTRTSSSL